MYLSVQNIYTSCVQKVSRILCFFKNYLFLHEYLFDPFKVISTRYYTLVPTFFPILEALQKIIFFCDLGILRCRLYLLNRSVASFFHRPLQFREQEKVTDMGRTVAAALLVCGFWPKIRCCFWSELSNFGTNFAATKSIDKNRMA